MSCTETKFDQVIGGGMDNRDELKALIVHAEYAGDPSGNITPNHVGQVCHDTSNDDWYIAHGSAAANWKISAT